MNMYTGIVKWYNETKGYGFIVSDDQKEVFVHKSGLEGRITLAPNIRVQYDLKDSEKGPVAVNVKTI